MAEELNCRIGSYSLFRDMNIELMSCQKTRRHICTRSYRRAPQALFCNVVPPFPPEQALFLPPIAARAEAGHEYFWNPYQYELKKKHIIHNLLFNPTGVW